MANSPLKHQKCGGNIFIDISPLLSFTTPSMSFTPEGLVLGVLEFSFKNSSTRNVLYHCEKCGNDISHEDTSKVTVECSVCYKEHSIAKTFTSFSIPVICEHCVEIVTGRAEPTTEQQRKVAKFLNFGSESKFMPFENILQSIRM